MKFKATPLLVIALILILLGLLDIVAGEGNLGPLNGFVAAIRGIECLLLYAVLRLIFPTRIRWQMLTEVLLVVIIAAYDYKQDRKILLCVPRNLQKDIIVVYGVDKTPAIPKEVFYSNHVKIKVPPSGIVLTSTQGLGNGLEFVDSLANPVTWLKPGYGIAYISDTMQYNNKEYNVSVFNRNALTDWKTRADSVKLIIKKEIDKAR